MILTRVEVIECFRAILQDNPLKNPYANIFTHLHKSSRIFTHLRYLQEVVKHLQEVKHFLVFEVSCKIFRGVLVVVGYRVIVDNMTSHTKTDTDFATIFNRIKQPIFGIILPTLPHWLVFLTEMPAAFERDVVKI